MHLSYLALLLDLSSNGGLWNTEQFSQATMTCPWWPLVDLVQESDLVGSLQHIFALGHVECAKSLNHLSNALSEIFGLINRRRFT